MRFSSRSFGILLVLCAASGTASAQVFSVPVRWCVIADDVNGNGRVDPGEEGAPAFTNPGQVGEPDADNVLWRRHERPSDAVFIPEAQVTFRSGIYNIVEDPVLRFPIISDPDPNPTGDPFWLYGDIIHPDDSTFEWNAAHNACVDAWRDVHGVEDIGVVAINANNVRTLSGDSEPGVAIIGGQRMLLRDNAYVLPGSPLNTFPVSDHVDKHFAHEMGHALAGLRHTCSDQNVMSNRRLDPSGDGLVDNIHLSSSIAQVTSQGADGAECTGDDGTSTVNQIQMLRDAAQAVAGCKIAGTNNNCTAQSDVRADRIKDAPFPFVDLSTFTASNHNGRTKLIHEPMGPIDRRHIRDREQSFDYYSFIDQDRNAATGGSASALGVPFQFKGAELATRVRVAIGQAGFSFTPTVWRFSAGTFQEVLDRRIRAYAFPLMAISEKRQSRLSDQITLELPTDIFGAGITDFRLQAAVVTTAPATEATLATLLDLLDEDREQPGRDYRWRSPKFPVCSVTPGTAPRLGAITVQASGFVPDRPVHLIFGDRHIANGHAGADGSVSISTVIPAHARDGSHLITVGTDGTALTADCVTDVKGGPRPPGDGQGGEGENLFEYPTKVVCGDQSDRTDLRLAPGAYRTTVNIRNAGRETVSFTEEFVLAHPARGTRSEHVGRFSEGVLKRGQAVATDCEDIRKRVFGGRLPAPYVDGWLVVRSRGKLDVTSVHTAAGLTTGASSIDVERVAERPVGRASPNE
jgi:hypothetical protein